MKVLFAVSNENISESIVRKYQKDYKEIISYKNVYYFNAILKEIQKDKSYDRIVISEDLEPFANNNYDQIDKFIFDKLDSISDEATNSEREDTPIILICTDRRTKSEDILVKLFSIGIYSAILGNDRNVEEICKLIRVPRTKKEAKVYYRIDADDASYQSENENDVSEAEIQNILSHYKRLGKNEEKYVESFNTIASQYTDEQLKIIINFLPLNVKAILESTSPKYQQIVTSMPSSASKTSYNPIQNTKPENNIKVNYIESKKGKETLGRPVIIPSAVDTNNVKKLNRKVSAQVEEIEPVEQSMPQVEGLEEIRPIEQPKRRGRPRKNPIAEDDIPTVDDIVSQPKRRGRPRKNPLPEEQEPVNLFEMSDDEEPVNSNTVQSSAGTLPGFDDLEDSDYENQTMKSNNNLNNQMGTLPGFDDDSDEEDTPVFNTNQRMQSAQRQQSPIQPLQKNYESNNYSSMNSSYTQNNSREITNTNIDYTNNNIGNLLTKDKKLVAFLGTTKNGTSFLVNNVAESLSNTGINVAILDATTNRNAYYIYTKNEEDLRQTAARSITGLINGTIGGIKVNKNLTVYTSIPEEDVGINNYEAILSTLVNNYSVVLIDCDFNTNLGYFASIQELYLVQSMDVLTIQPLTAFLRELKTKNILDPEKIRIVINKETRVRSLTPKTIIGGMSFYNDPAMSFMTELFNREKVKYCTIPFEEQTYSKYLEGLVNCKISLNGYSKEFMQALKTLENMVYPLIGSKQEYKPVNNYNNTFSSDMNNTLNQMKNKY